MKIFFHFLLIKRSFICHNASKCAHTTEIMLLYCFYIIIRGLHNFISAWLLLTRLVSKPVVFYHFYGLMDKTIIQMNVLQIWVFLYLRRINRFFFHIKYYYLTKRLRKSHINQYDSHIWYFYPSSDPYWFVYKTFKIGIRKNLLCIKTRTSLNEIVIKLQLLFELKLSTYESY